MELRDRIKAIRKAIGMSQAKFANRIAISKTYMSDIETGNKETHERVIRLIVSELNVNGNWLRTGKGSMFNDGVNIYSAEAMGMFNRLCPVLQEGTLKFLEEMLKVNEHLEAQSKKS